MKADGIPHCSSVRRQLFPLNDFFSRTTRPISTKLGRNDAWENGIQIYSNKEAGPFRRSVRTSFVRPASTFSFQRLLLKNH